MRTTRKSLLSLLLVLAMTVGCLGALSLGGVSAAEVAENKTAPAITPKGEYDVWDGTTVSESLSQDEKGVYLIQSAADFVYFYNTVAATTTAVTESFRLTRDIDISAKNMMGAIAFAGTLNGDGHVIKGAGISTGDYGTIRNHLFSSLTGVVENLNMVEFNLYGKLHANSLFGSITGANAAVRNCHFSGTQFASAGGGVLASSIGDGATIDGVVMSGTVNRSNGNNIGVFASTANNCTIKNSANYMTVLNKDAEPIANNGSVSGFIYQTNSGYGGVEGPKFYSCTNYADITVTYGDVAAFIARGYRHTSLTMKNCINYGDITVTAATESNTVSVGGIIANTGDANANFSADVSGVYNYGNINAPGAKEVGGIVGSYGHKAKVTFSDCANYGDVTGGLRVGGFFGYCYATQYTSGYITMTNGANYGDVTATTGYAGGIAGYYGDSGIWNTMTVQGCVLLGNVTGALGAASLYGYFQSHDVRVQKVAISDSVIKNTLSAGNGATGLVCASSVKTDEDGFTLTCTNAYISTNAAYAHYNASGVGTVEDLTGTELPANALTDGTALALLNSYANTNSYTPWEMGESAPELLPAVLELSAANLTLRGELVMNMKMDSSALKNLDPSLVNGVFVKTESGSWEGNLMTFDNDDPYYYVAVDGLTAETFSLLDTYYVVVIYNGVEYTAHEGTVYSPVKYAERMYADADAETKTVLESIIRYAYYAELNADGESNLLADFNAAVGSNLTEADLDALYNTDLVRGDVDASAMSGIATVGSFLGENLNLVFVLDESVTGLTMKVAGETFTYTPEAGHIVIDDLHAGMVRAKLTLTFQTEGGEITATYAISNYLNTVVENGETVAQQNLAKAAMLYMAAARDYAL